MSRTRYIIEGNLAIKEVVTRSEGVPLDNMLEGLTAYQPLDLSPTPSNLKSISVKPRPNMELEARIIVGHDPMTRRITHKNCSAASHSAPPINYELQMPYGLFWFALHGNRLRGTQGESIVWNPQGWGYLWMKEPFVDYQSIVYTPTMPNIFSDSRICFGSNSANGSLPLGHYIDQSVNTFWTSEFNQDLSNSFPNGMNLQDWADAPPRSWTDWDSFRSGRGNTLQEKVVRFEDDMQWDDPVPSDTGDTIPPLPTFPTFDNLQRWMEELNNDQRARLYATFENERENFDVHA